MGWGHNSAWGGIEWCVSWGVIIHAARARLRLHISHSVVALTVRNTCLVLGDRTSSVVTMFWCIDLNEVYAAHMLCRKLICLSTGRLLCRDIPSL